MTKLNSHDTHFVDIHECYTESPRRTMRGGCFRGAGKALEALVPLVEWVAKGGRMILAFLGRSRLLESRIHCCRQRGRRVKWMHKEMMALGFEGGDESVNRSVPAGRYFAALRGPELDQVKDYEDILLPKDEPWPFLLRFPIGCFGICLGLASQSILWLALSASPATKFLRIPPEINLALWLLAAAALAAISAAYSLKCLFYFEAVRREYFHPVRVNFFFAPWIVLMFLAIGAPPMVFPRPIHPAVWCVFMGPIFFLELKIYGQWLSGGKRRLCKVANPSSHLSVVGNFVGAILAAKVGWKEAAKFLWAVGFAHYLVVFVTLYQRLPTSEALPKELHPVYSMFIAAPSAASIAWEAIYGEFDGLSRTCYFIALFLYVSLVVRINFFTGFRFSVAWWSYTFPMTTASLATIKYAEHVPSVITKGLALTLSLMSSTMVSVLFISTLLHAFLWHTLFPNDLAIAITKRRHGKDQKKPIKRAYDIRRWTKSPLSLVSSITKHNSGNKDSDGQKEAED
ncbi:C4-dicarboxylate transporter/malic acid transport protein [Actinidia rufa]|uniref:C4-dicarboxylate transporter/malic acid transport protein n=1 Tax=Actinidia rufa TaxID=165716 RepID=A0A7J0DFQ7_9ERIC|nr:C4-dicarboxylate transporter/malic acid transport protein [Actinidia rufa]